MEMIKYMIEVIVCSGLFLVTYRWLLAKKVSFGVCRAFIMASMLLAVVIPVMNVPVLPEKTVAEQAILTEFDFFEVELEGTASSGSVVGTETAETMAVESVPVKRLFDVKLKKRIGVFLKEF